MKNWGRKKIVDISTVFEDGDWIESKDQSAEGIRLIQTGNVGNGIFKDRGEKARYILEDTFKRLRCTEIFEGDCLISRLPDPVGRACILPDTGEKMITAVDCTIIRFDQKQLISNWFLYYSLSNEYQNEIQKQVTGATRQRISRKNLGLVFVPLPPLPEQQRIVSILDQAFASIANAKANAEQNHKNAKELFESYLQGVFENGKWETKKLNEITEVKDGTHDSPKYIKEGIPFVTQKNIKPDGLSFDDTKFITDKDHEKFYKRSNVTYGDILISMIGANRGMAAIVDDKRVFSIKNVGLIKSSDNINMNYLLYYLKSSIAMKYVLYMSNGGAQEFVGLTALRSFPIPLPPLNVQQTIVRKLDALRAETQKLEAVYQKKIIDLEELKKSILQKAFSGAL
ncbi:MAG TPA: restriction endonuclease subunit S [Saprospiraceae bacterium]|nr:restriction endonuclease subunit S [Saprospiraceae bacterium]